MSLNLIFENMNVDFKRAMDFVKSNWSSAPAAASDIREIWNRANKVSGQHSAANFVIILQAGISELG